jgi:hypothetical protein
MSQLPLLQLPQLQLLLLLQQQQPVKRIALLQAASLSSLMMKPSGMRMT